MYDSDSHLYVLRVAATPGPVILPTSASPLSPAEDALETHHPECPHSSLAFSFEGFPALLWEPPLPQRSAASGQAPL